MSERTGGEGAGRPVVLVSREFHFDAAHCLPNYHGRCERLHGHRWQVRVTVKAPVEPSTGIAIDFLEIDRVVKAELLDRLDHAYLNEELANPSAENLALLFWAALGGKLPLDQIEVWETPRNKVAYRGEARE